MGQLPSAVNPATSKKRAVGRQAGRLPWHVAIVAVGVAAAAVVHYRQTRWKRFAVVEPNRIYRSGQLSSGQLEAAIAKLQLKTVICLNPESVASDSEVCRRRGVGFRAIEMPSDGIGPSAAFAVALETLGNPQFQPVLVHCQAGVARTGACVALHRMLHQGWSAEQALAELRSFERRGRLEPKLRDHVVAVAEQLSQLR